MVIAEVPLWVVHSNSGAASKDAPMQEAGKDDSTKERASESLRLLEKTVSASTQQGFQKAAIYSVDAHGTRFATGGGDGTVRIWNAGALFPKPKTLVKNNYQKRPLDKPDQSITSSNHYESSGESSQEDLVDSPPHDKVKAKHAPARDLSSMVRRKGDPATPTKGAPASTETPDADSSDTDSQTNNKTKQHRLLCTLSAHTGSSVLAVRFSNNGKYLASAGDDAVVCVYAKQKQKTHQSGLVAHGNLESTSCTVEHWIRVKLCRGHGLDAVGLAWAPDDSHLVSCSLDSNTPIIVWKLTDLATHHSSSNHYSNVLCNPYKVLGKGIHTSTVKGVTFDPAGTYLASSGDDPSVCIWRAHDDWGLEQKIDSRSGIFRKWNTNATNLSSQSLFRRLSWSTDGAYICATNAVVKNKNVASTISREGWAVSSSKSTAAGAVNLVGHKQPVVACRHCPYLLNNKSPKENVSDDTEPDYSTLLALGDKKGFVTVWSTRKSRPIFKIQCSESRCTVTDLTWGKCLSSKTPAEGDLMLLVSLLDGQVVALRFGIPDEFGLLLSSKEQARVFQLRYGIDLNGLTHSDGRGLFVGDNLGRPKLIENALQFSFENQNIQTENDEEDDEEDEEIRRRMELENAARQKEATMTSAEIQKKQLESRSKGGKKRIQPLLMMQTAPLPVAKKPRTEDGGKAKKLPDTLETAMELAEKAALGAAAAQKSANKTTTSGPMTEPMLQQQQLATDNRHQPSRNIQLLAGVQSTPQIPHSTDRIHSIDLPFSKSGTESGRVRYVVDCVNFTRVPKGPWGNPLPCTELSISKGGQKLWKDQLLGSACSAIAASKSFLVVGTSDGSIQVFGTSPTLGWESGNAFRSHPPFVLGRPIVALHLLEDKSNNQTTLLVVSSDGNFGVYTLEPRIKIQYKGSLLPAMTHMLLSADLETDLYLPKLARIQLTETNRLLLLLSLHSINTQGGTDDGRSGQAQSVGAGGSLQGFIYDREAELWMRVSDSRFVLSDFYNTLPSFSSKKTSTTPPTGGPLAKLDDSVRMGASASSLQRSRRGPSLLDSQPSYQSTTTSTTRQLTNDDGGNDDIASRSHCEDRMACALMLGSASEFEFWFSMYVKLLSITGNESLLRLVIDMLLGKYSSQGPSPSKNGSSSSSTSTCWWLSECPHILKFDRVKLVKTVVIPEMSKNRALQRITNEIAVDVEMHQT